MNLQSDFSDSVKTVCQILNIDYATTLDSLFFHLNSKERSSGETRLSQPENDVTFLAHIGDYLDATLLHPKATTEEYAKLCKDAIKHRIKTVCVPSSRVAECRALLSSTPVVIAAVVGFPHGTAHLAAKLCEARQCVLDGAREIDFVPNLANIAEGNLGGLFDEVTQIVQASSPANVKVILETAWWDTPQLERCCVTCVLAGCEYVKTSTGYNTEGASRSAVQTMASIVGTSAKVKASGGIQDLENALSYLHLGASRIGTSAAVSIASEAQSRLSSCER